MTSFITKIEEEEEQQLLQNRVMPIPLGNWKLVIEALFSTLKKTPFSNPWVFTGQRALAGALLRGCSPERIVDSRMGARPYKILPSSEHAGHRALHAVGFSKASNEVVFCILGQAALANGSFLSACNLLQLQPSKVVFVVIEQEILEEAPVAKQSIYSMSKMAELFGLGYFEVSVDGIAEDALYKMMNETLLEIWKGALESKSSLFRIRLS